MQPLDIGCAIFLTAVMVVLAVIGYVGDAAQKRKEKKD